MPRPADLTLPYAFVSYSSRDRAHIERIVSKLVSEHVPVWTDQRRLLGGMRWGREIARAIRECTVFVLCCSEASLQSRDVFQEIQLAWKAQRPYLPLRLDATAIPEQIEYFLEGWQWIDVYSMPEAEWLPLALQALRELGVGHTRTPLQAAETPSGGTSENGAPSSQAASSTQRELTIVPSNLPYFLTSFIGRQEELTEVRTLLSRTRLLTLTGTGGCGKTRLAQQVARMVMSAYPDGVWIIDLAPVDDPLLVPQTVARVLGVMEQSDATLMSRLIEHLRQKRMLLLLDNCEHLVQSCADLASSVLQACPYVRFFVTSRSTLDVAGETVWRVPSLSRPLPPPPPLPVAQLTQYEAVRLFIDRGTAANPAFKVTNENAPAVAALCFYLDGIPLAIELAAPWLRIFTVDQIASQISDRLDMLESDDRTMPPRHRTIRATIDWSYMQLAEDEQTLLSRLAVFRGGTNLDALLHVCASDPLQSRTVPRLLLSLVNRSLIQRDDHAGEVRFYMLETVREYAAEQLAARNEHAPMRAAHASYYHEIAASMHQDLAQSNVRNILDRGEIDSDNLRTALNYLCEVGDADLALEMALGMARFWLARGYLVEGRMWLGKVLALAVTPSRGRCEALSAMGRITHQQGDLAETRKLADIGLEESRQIGFQEGEIEALATLGFVTRGQGDYESAGAYLEQGLTLSRQTGDARHERDFLLDLGIVSALSGDNAKAHTYLEKFEEECERAHDDGGMTRAHFQLGCVEYAENRLASASTHAAYSVEHYQRSGDRLGAAYALSLAGYITAAQAEFHEGSSMLQDGLRIRKDANDADASLAQVYTALAYCKWGEGLISDARAHALEALTILQDHRLGTAPCIAVLALIAEAAGDASRAARLLGVLASLSHLPRHVDGFGMPLFSVPETALADLVQQCKSHLGLERFEELRAQGRALQGSKAMALVIG